MFDAKDEGLDEFEKNLETLIKHMPKEVKMILRKGGSKARTIYARKGRSLVGSKDPSSKKSFHKRWKRGKVFQGEDETYRVRTYNNSPHVILLEDGHRIVGKDGSEHGFQPGYKIMDKANKEVEEQWDKILESEIDKLIDKM